MATETTPEATRVETPQGYAGTIFYNEAEEGWYWSCYRGHSNDEAVKGRQQNAAAALQFHTDEGECKSMGSSLDTA